MPLQRLFDKRRRRRFGAALASALILPAAIAPCAIAAAGTESASFLEIPVGAGPAAMGSAYSALATDAYASVWNPGGLAFVPSLQVAAQQLSYLQSINYEYLGGAIPIKEGRVLGFSAQYLGSGNIPGADLNGNSLPGYSVDYGAYSLAYGQSIGERLGLGVTAKWLKANISDVDSNSFAADFGMLYKMTETLNVSATLANIGTKLTFLNDDNSLPLTGRIGMAWSLSRHWLAAAEGDIPKAGSASGHAGLQWKPIDLIAIRAGYRSDTTQNLGGLTGLTTGIGLALWGQEFSYAWLPYGDLGNTQYFSLLVRFGGKDENEKNLLHGETIKIDRQAAREAPLSDQDQLTQLLYSADNSERAAKTPAAKPLERDLP